ncbi:hypothetical protein F5B22DRAFT_622186 [Xylaria bambusicola]|uniref:uncharacterized protein n=1 Tax=Xylaria bambusicola TaxID=326684 RepID=UPI0020084F1C|nr:uncharacterized protein F5B22DRAFT_622186 [Xylaria bambusicola]KAI0506820.1 hypothetical protein F5B22DRAFT_622186 [Xylaria bambusicola]
MTPFEIHIQCLPAVLIHHAEALVYAIENLVFSQSPWSPSSIKQVHHTLYSGRGQLPTSPNIKIPYSVVPGEYRTHAIIHNILDVASGKQKTVRLLSPAAIAPYMERWIIGVNRDMVRLQPYTGARVAGDPMLIPFDPYECAATHFFHFVSINPFGDVKKVGRISRIILNCLVLLFAGHLMPIGDRKGDEEHFLQLVDKASWCFYKSGKFDRGRAEENEENEEKRMVCRELALFMLAKAPRLRDPERFKQGIGSRGSIH